MLSLINR